MKILITNDTYYPNINGAAEFSRRLAQMLSKRGHSVFVLAPSTKLKNTVTTDEAGVTVYGIRSIPVPIYRGFRICLPKISKSAIKAAIQEIMPEIIHIQGHFTIGKETLDIAKKLNIPIMGTNHFMPENLVHYFNLPQPAENWLKNFGWRQFFKVFCRLELVTAPTQTAVNMIKNQGLKNLMPVSCGIDLQRFNPKNKGDYLKEKYGIKANKIMLYTGRLDKEKNIDLILRAMPEILKNEDVHFVVVGRGKMEKYLKNLGAELGLSDKISFIGFVDKEELPDFYCIADVFVIAGIAELQSIVTMEAMASGLPVIAANAVALPELVHDGENGYLFRENDSQELAEKIIKILKNEKLAREMSRKSLSIIKNHDIEKTISRYESLYEQVISKGRF